jgi:hypothetical protein
MNEKRFTRILGLAVPAMIISSPAFAGPGPQLAYQNISTSWRDIDGLFSVPLGQWGLDDLNVVGGGDLASLTFAYGATAGIVTPTARADADVRLWVDNGNGTFGSEDTQIYTEHFSKIVCSAPPASPYCLNQYTVNFDPGAVAIPNNAKIWAGLMFSNQTIGNLMQSVFFGPPTVGSTDGYAYQEDVPAGGLPHVIQTTAPTNAGLGFALSVFPEPASLALLAIGAVSLLGKQRRR